MSSGEFLISDDRFKFISTNWFSIDLEDRYLPTMYGEIREISLLKWLEQEISGSYYWQLELGGKDIDWLSIGERIFSSLTANKIWFENEEDLILFKFRWL